MAMDSLAAEFGDLLIQNVEETGIELGRGSYGVVFEVKWRGELRAAKKLHDFFFEPELRDLPGTQKEVRNFKREFRSWAKLDHPNMVRLLGLYYNPSRSVRAPIIVMEKIDISLGDYLEKHTRQSFPLHLKVWVLLQVAQALSYLHGQAPPLVHHDLKPDNIMITTNNFTAKLTDFGMIRAITRGSLTRGSSMKGTPVFMPPEAMEIPLRYDEQLDVFSYGVVIISALVHDKAPLPCAATLIREGRQVAVSDFDRRKPHTDKFSVEEQRLFMPVVRQCLEYAPNKRPLSSQLVDKMSNILVSLPSAMPSNNTTDGKPLKAVNVHQPQEGYVQLSSEKKVPHGSVDETRALKEKVAMLERRCLQAETERKAMEESHLKLQKSHEELHIAKLQATEAADRLEAENRSVMADRESLSEMLRSQLDKMQEIMEKVRHIEKRGLQAEAERNAMEESHVKLQQSYQELDIENGLLKLQCQEAMGHSKAEHQLAQADREGLRKQCQRLQEERRVISQNSAELHQKVADMEVELRRLKEFEARYNIKEKRELEQTSAELHQKLYDMEHEVKELRAFKSRVTSGNGSAPPHNFIRQMSNPTTMSGPGGGATQQSLPPGWQARETSDGAEYFVNCETKSVSWDRPDW